MADSEHNSNPVDPVPHANHDSRGSRSAVPSRPNSDIPQGERAHASTSSGTVIMPRSGGRALAGQQGSLESNSSFAADRPRGPRGPLSQDEVADLVSQQTVISQQPWTEPPEYGSVTPREMGKLLAGQTLGHYSLLEFVGGGGMGAVFRARDTMLNRTVAVKVLAPGQSSDEDTLRRFQNEAQSAARLDHENIGRVHYVGQDRGWHYIVFEFIEGENLRDLVERRGPLSLAETLDFLQQLGDALDHADAREVVHRDIKPSNVIITPENRAKLVDMGLARLHQVEHSQEDLTASGVTLGTFDYISPEQARDPRSADVRSDLYSLGCTLYYMLTGRPPFPHGTVLQKLLQHQADEPADPRASRPDLPTELIAILHKLSAKLPTKRYQTPRELLVDVRALSIKLGLRAPSVARDLPTVPVHHAWWYRNLPWLVPIALIVAIPLLVPLFEAAPTEPQRPSWYRPAATERASVVTPNATSPSSIATSRKIAANTNTVPKQTSPLVVSSPELSVGNGGPVPVIMDFGRDYSQRLASNYMQNWQETIWPSVTNAMPKLPDTLRDAGYQGLEAGFGKIFDPIATIDKTTDKESRTNEFGNARLIVALGTRAAGEYASLGAAVRDARPGDTIELRYTGVLEEKPFALATPRLSIVAAEGERPVIKFIPQEVGAMNPTRGMISINGGEFRASGIGFILEITDRIAAENRSLFELRQVERVSCENCVITIVDASGAAAHSQVCVFDLLEGVSTTLARLNDPRAIVEPTRIALDRSIVRGNAGLVRSLEHEAVVLTATRAWLALSASAIYADYGARDGRRGNEPRFRMEFRESTAILGHGLARLINPERTVAREACEFRCTNTVLRGDETNPLFEIEGLDRVEDLRDLVRWESDGVRIDRFSTLARLSGMNGTTNLGTRQWNEYWRMRQQHTRMDTLEWVVTRENLPRWSNMAPVDLTWRNRETLSDGNSTVGESVEGVAIEQLPTVDDFDERS